MILQRKVNDASLDRGHGGQELLATIAPDALGDFPSFLFQLLNSLAFELLTVKLDVLLESAADESLVCQHLQRIDRFTMMFDHAVRIAPIEPNDHLLLTLFGAHLQLQPGESDHALAPFANGGGDFRLRCLFRRGLFDERCWQFIVAPIVVLAMAVAPLPAPPLIARPLSSSAGPSAASRGTFLTRTARRGSGGSRSDLFGRGLVDLRLDDDPFHAAEEAALFHQHVIGELIALDAERLGRAIESVFEILSFETLRHVRSSIQAVCSSAGWSFQYLFMIICCTIVKMFCTSQ